MTDSNSYSSSTVSGTGTGVTNADSTGVSSTSTAVTTIVQTSSPDDSQGLGAVLGGEAVAVGTDTATVGSLSATLIDGGSATTADLSGSMAAISESSDGAALALADTFAGASGSTEVLVGATVQSASSTQSATGSVATATSTTNVVAADIHPSTTGVGGGATVETGTAGETDPVAGTDDAQADGDIDGNIALLEFDALAVGDDTLVSVDAFVLAVEDELSVSSGLIEIAIG